MHFLPCFRFPPPYFRKSFRLHGKFSQFQTFFDFHPPKFLMNFSSHWLKILNFPLFILALSVHFTPISGILLFPPYFFKFPLWFCKIYVFFTYFTCFSFPHNLTMMHLCITQCTYTGRPCPFVRVNISRFNGKHVLKVAGEPVQLIINQSINEHFIRQEDRKWKHE